MEFLLALYEEYSDKLHKEIEGHILVKNRRSLIKHIGAFFVLLFLASLYFESLNAYLVGFLLAFYASIPWKARETERLEFLVYTVEVALQEIQRGNREDLPPETKFQVQVHYAESEFLLEHGKTFLEKEALKRIAGRLLSRNWVYFTQGRGYE